MLDDLDRAEAKDIERMCLRVLVTNTIMSGLEEKVRLAREVSEFVSGLVNPNAGPTVFSRSADKEYDSG